VATGPVEASKAEHGPELRVEPSIYGRVVSISYVRISRIAKYGVLAHVNCSEMTAAATISSIQEASVAQMRQGVPERRPPGGCERRATDASQFASPHAQPSGGRFF
jgi:hypothetical protein